MPVRPPPTWTHVGLRARRFGQDPLQELIRFGCLGRDPPGPAQDPAIRRPRRPPAAIEVRPFGVDDQGRDGAELN
jgi:hypothetical protein